MIDVVADGGRVDAVVCYGKSGLFAVKAGIYIDCTGDGDLAVGAGAPFEKGDAQGNLMPGTLCQTWAGVDWDVVRASGLGGGASRLEDAFRDGIFSVPDHHLPGIWRTGKKLGGGNVGHTFGVDGTDERSLTEQMIWGRKLICEYERYYKEYLKGFESMELAATGSLMGLRETRRVMGDYVLCEADFVARAVFDDEIGRYCYPVDIHPCVPGDKKAFLEFEKEFGTTLRYQAGESYGIPYRCLTPQGLDNVLVAGRCISCDRKILGSVRVMPGCFITGQAAGVAASISVEKGCTTREVPVGELTGKLLGQGAYLPNA